MSFDLFIRRFVGGEDAPFPAAILHASFGPFVSEVAPEWLLLRFGPGEGDTCTLFVDNNAEEINDFSINRPLKDPRLYEALLRVLKLPGVVLFMPGDCPPLIGIPDTAEHLPPDMIETLGEPVVLKAAAEIPLRILQA